MTSVSTPSSASVQEALKRMSHLRDNDFTGHDCRSRGTEASKEETDTINDDRVQHCVQFRSGIQCDDQLGNTSAQRHFDTTITSVLSDNSSVAPICCGHPPEGKDERQTGKCSDDGRGNKFKRCWMRVPCVTEAMQRRGLSSFSLLRSDGVGNHDAQTREKIFGWLTEKRHQKRLGYHLRS